MDLGEIGEPPTPTSRTGVHTRTYLIIQVISKDIILFLRSRDG
jgi:hypothetical protein